MSSKVRFHNSPLPAGQALRHAILNKITPILLSTDFIGDSTARLTIAASCKEVVTSLEELIAEYGLDQLHVQAD